MPRLTPPIASLLLSSLVTCTAHAMPAYQITDLGSLGSDVASASSINNKGEVVGTFKTPEGSYRAFVYSNGQLQFIEPPAGELDSIGWRINESGQVLTNHGLLSDGQITKPLMYATSYAGLNNLGHYTGSASIPGNTYSHPYIYDGFGLADLGTLSRTSTDYATGIDINDKGQVTGYSQGDVGGGVPRLPLHGRKDGRSGHPRRPVAT